MQLPALPAGETKKTVMMPISFKLEDREFASLVAAAAPATIDEWKTQAHDLLAANSRYPDRMRNRNLQGDVKLRIRVNAQGDVIAASILEGSGDDNLDRSAVRSIRQFAQLPALPAGSDTLNFDIKVKYRLN